MRAGSLRLIVRTLSEICVTAGAVIVLFVAYLLLWTGVKAADASDDEIVRLQEEWTRLPLEPSPSPPPSTTPAPSAPSRGYEPGKPFAVLYIPRFGAEWDWPVLEGTSAGTLKKGLGHYPGSARPGETGNFAVAGHRRTYGDPFKDFPRLRPGDAVILTDGTTWFTYRVKREPFRTVPSDVAVIDPVPKRSGFDGPGRYLTLTTCDPEWGSSHRLIVWAYLDGTRPVTDGKPEAFHS
ncbi:class E sortase [Streptomyces sp. NPDC059828]|uniref:class E sortase n=1 Tax=Streptomyces sp. NPDC059828 TaxID=3346965 RepID=UPI00364D47DF